jgi:hypothetical protein
MNVPEMLFKGLVAVSRTMGGMLLGLALLLRGAAAMADTPAAEPVEMPMEVFDDSANDWIIDRFAGNSQAGDEFFQGPAAEVGGLGRPGVLAQPDGNVVLFLGKSVCQVAPDGTLELMRQDGYFSPIEGVMEAKAGGDASILEGRVEKRECIGDLYNEKEKAYYSFRANCLRKVTTKPDGSLQAEVVAGVPYTAGTVDGAGAAARLAKEIRGVVLTADGTIYWGEFPSSRIRKYKDGTVTTLNPVFKDPPANINFIMNSGRIDRGEDDGHLLIADSQNFKVRRLDLATMEVANVAGMPAPGKEAPAWLKRRYGPNSDGPALTHVYFNSGVTEAIWDPCYKAIWVAGCDEGSLRWLKDGWVKRVIAKQGAEGGWNCDARNIPASKARIMWSHVVGIDSRGGVYFTNGANKTGVWRAYNPKMGGKP